MSIQLFGQPVSRGVAIGRGRAGGMSSRVDVAHYFIDVAHVPAEVARLRQARDTVVQEITCAQERVAARGPYGTGRFCSTCT